MTQVAEPTTATSTPTARVQHWIGGKPYERRSDRHGDVFNPATGEVQAKVAFATPAVVV